MMRFGRLFLRTLKSPSSFENRPWLFLFNQAGHMLLLGSVPALVLPWWIVIVAYLIWETAQMLFFDSDDWDAVEDIGFVTTGVLAVVVHPVVIIPATIFLISGLLRRM